MTGACRLVPRGMITLLIDVVTVTSPNLGDFFAEGDVLDLEFELNEHERHVSGSFASGYLIKMDINENVPSPDPFSLMLGAAGFYYLRRFQRRMN